MIPPTPFSQQFVLIGGNREEIEKDVALSALSFLFFNERNKHFFNVHKKKLSETINGEALQEVIQ